MKNVHVLLVEDNEGDIILTLEAFSEGNLKNTISVARDGQEALNFLYKQGDYANAQTPDIILLDINLPRINGKEVLHIIKSDAALKTLPVIMLTTSSSEKDIAEAYKSYANCYITKPVGFADFMGVIRAIEDFWVSLVKLPANVGIN